MLKEDETDLLKEKICLSLSFIRINADLTKKKTQRKKRIHMDDTN